ncbi:hypothetical protein [Echinicola shivajiensis]|nr:hypothetical protein [Echinicola shivajiensis]
MSVKKLKKWVNKKTGSFDGMLNKEAAVSYAGGVCLHEGGF